MSEYIERESLISNLKDLPEQERIEYMGIYDCIKSQHTADVVEIRHGKWLTADIVEIRHGKWLEDEYDETTYCSECKEEALYESTFELQFDYDWEENLVPCGYEEHRAYIKTKFCPNCGARMDGDTE